MEIKITREHLIQMRKDEPQIYADLMSKMRSPAAKQVTTETHEKRIAYLDSLINMSEEELSNVQSKDFVRGVFPVNKSSNLPPGPTLEELAAMTEPEKLVAMTQMLQGLKRLTPLAPTIDKLETTLKKVGVLPSEETGV